MTYTPVWGSADVSAETGEWLARVDKVASLIEAQRDRAESDRRTPGAVIDALHDVGITRMWVSEQFGGARVSLRTGTEVVQEIARLDASTAWQIGVQGAIGRLSDYLSEPVARELFRDSYGLVIGSVNPSGRAERVPGGYLLSGRWAFASGYAHAEWLVCAAVVTEDGTPRRGPAGPEIRMLFLPRSRSSARDTWHTVGLRGTGSVHYDVPDGTFVADEYTVDGASMLLPPPERESRGYPIAYHDFGPFTSSSTALGIARESLEAFRGMVEDKTPAGGTSPLAASHTTQDRLARAEMLVHTSRVLLAHSCDQVTEHGAAGGPELSALVRLTAATVAENATAAVDAVYGLAGSSSLYATSRIERCFRDVHSANKHITVSPSHFETVGQFLLGGELVMRR